MADRVATPEEHEAAVALIEGWLEAQLADNPVVEAVEREGDQLTGQRRWFVRVRGEEKNVWSVWFLLRQRTLHYETYVMPAPEENHEQFFEHLLRRNLRFNDLRFAIGAEDAVFLLGESPLHALDEGELDRILGSFYAYVEQCFRPALRIGFASRFS